MSLDRPRGVVEISTTAMRGQFAASDSRLANATAALLESLGVQACINDLTTLAPLPLSSLVSRWQAQRYGALAWPSFGGFCGDRRPEIQRCELPEAAVCCKPCIRACTSYLLAAWAGPRPFLRSSLNYGHISFRLGMTRLTLPSRARARRRMGGDANSHSVEIERCCTSNKNRCTS